MSDPILPLQVWPEGIFQARLPANDNSLSVEATLRPCLGVANDEATPADGDVWIVGSAPTGAFASFDEHDVTLYMDGNWKAWAPFEGMRLVVNDVRKVYTGALWDDDPSISGGAGAWGSITGTLSAQTDLQAALDAKASDTQTGECISGLIVTPADGDYRIVVKAPHAGTITEVTTISASGTCTLTVKINTTALGGTANSVSSSEQSQAHASSNAFSAGDDIVLAVSSNASCSKMTFTIKYTRTLA